MIKQLKKTDVITSPFKATKARELFNIENDDLVDTEPLSGSSSIPPYEIALDYVDYLSGLPLLNRDCNIALEQQTDDEILYEEGITGSGVFNPDTDPKNESGTYKRLVYNQVQRAFYNDYRNPIEIFGMENIDFPLSRTNRYLAEKFRVFTIPRLILGDKVVAGSIEFQDTAFDDNVAIHDDSYGNLIAGDHLFSKVQEVRHLGNEIIEGTASYQCPAYYDGPPLFIPSITVFQL